MKETFFSIIIPVGKNASIDFLKSCLKALDRQTYKELETIIVTDKDTSAKIKPLLDKYQKIKILTGNFNKSEARNFGASKALGNYLLHIDIDYVLYPKTLEKCIELIRKSKAKAIILRESVKPSENLWQKARALEKEIIAHDFQLSAPQIIEKRLFEKIGGFDEQVDALDDWILNLKFKMRGIVPVEITSPLTYIHEPTNMVEIVERRYKKGQYLPALRKHYGQSPQTNFVALAKTYLSSFNKIVSRPHIFFALVILKLIDLTAFYLGSLNSIKVTPPSGVNIYEDKKVARTFDRQQKSIYGQYKHKKEVNALLAILGEPNGVVLELGAGTGRITEELVKRGYKVIPTDVSRAMLAEFKKKKALPKPILIKPGLLPFSDNQFDTIIAIRVIWHIQNKKEREKFLIEAIRVSKNSVIMDFAMKGMGLNFLFKNDYYCTKGEIQKLAKQNKTKILTSKPLPFGRRLIKFEKRN